MPCGAPWWLSALPTVPATRLLRSFSRVSILPDYCQYLALSVFRVWCFLFAVANRITIPAALGRHTAAPSIWHLPLVREPSPNGNHGPTSRPCAPHTTTRENNRRDGRNCNLGCRNCQLPQEPRFSRISSGAVCFCSLVWVSFQLVSHSSHICLGSSRFVSCTHRLCRTRRTRRTHHASDGAHSRTILGKIRDLRASGPRKRPQHKYQDI